jgi:hypothetical protein
MTRALLSGAPVTANEDLKVLATFAHLRKLVVIGPELTDQCLVHLEKLRHVEEVTLIGTRISTEGTLALQRSLRESSVVVAPLVTLEE